MKKVGLYLLHGEPLLCEILEEGKNKLKIKDERGRETFLPEGRILLKGVFSGELGDLRRKVDEILSEVEVELLYEGAEGEVDKRFTVDELSTLYFGESGREFAKKVAIFLVLYQDRLYFKRFKDFTFSPRSKEEMELIKAEMERKEREERFVRKVLEDLKTGGSSQEKKEFLEKLYKYFDNPDVLSDGDVRLVERILKEHGGGSIREVAVLILKKEGLIKNELEEFFFLKGVRTRFPRQVEKLAQELAQGFSVSLADREDLRSLYTFAIDDEDTKEVDDAISYEKSDGREVVYIHISDLSPTVIKDDPIDREAFKRGTTIYTPYGTFPMIPTPISYGVGSLLEGEERYALTYKLVFENGELVEYEIVPSVVVVDRRLIYDYVDQILSGEVEDRLGDVLRRLKELAESLKSKRLKRGGFFIPKREVKVKLEDGKVSFKILDPMAPSRQLIGEFMIAANYVASKFSFENKIPVIYRAQQPPEGTVEVEDGVYQEDLPLDTLRTIFRMIRPSQLSLHPSFHWGLGLDTYIQITSPIRRYSDLVLQRQLVSFLTTGKVAYDEMELMKVIAMAEDTFKDFKNMERKIVEGVVKRYFMENRGPFPATVKDKISRGYLISPLDLPIRLPLITDKVYKFGDKVKVVSEVVGDGNLIFYEAPS